MQQKSISPQRDTSNLENEIDSIVFKLYNLTFEEVKVVDPDSSLAEEEYNAIKIE